MKFGRAEALLKPLPCCRFRHILSPLLNKPATKAAVKRGTTPAVIGYAEPITTRLRSAITVSM